MSSLYCTQGHLNPTDSRFCRLCGEPLQLVQSAQAAAHLLGLRYRVVSEVGQGGFGRTYLAEDSHRFNERCVLKEFAPQDQAELALQKAEELFAREAGILYQLQHAQIPRFRELFRAEWQGRDRLFLVQDYVDGKTYAEILQERRSRQRCFSESEVIQLLFQLLPVLHYIHSVGVIHRDISPDNLICRAVDGLPVLIDYGGVKQVAAKVVSAGYPALALRNPGNVTRLGKVGYAPAEQLEQGEVYPHSDLYALAVTVLVLVTGKEPQALFQSASGFNRRQWQQDLSLNRTLTSVLDQMLDPYPAKRFQSAYAVLQALERGGLGKMGNLDGGLTPIQPRLEIATHPPDPATIALAPSFPVEHTQAVLAPAARAPLVRSPLKLRQAVSWLLLTGMIIGGWWIGVKWLGPALKSKLPDIIQSGGKKQSNQAPSGTKSTNAAIAPSDFSKTEQERKQQITTRRQQLGIETAFWVNLVNEAFYAKYPDRNGQKLGSGASDAPLRAEWDALALQLLTRVAGLSPEARSRLGQYSAADLRDRQQAANQLNLSSRALNDLTDARFFQAFPEVPRGKNLLDQPIGQVWQAIATDELTALQAGRSLEKVQFSADNFSDRLSGSLKPGEGKAYLARLTQNQTLKLQLQASTKAARLSFYPPTGKSPALLEDSSATEWSGKLAETGLYEIVITAGSDPVNYTLDIAAAENITLVAP